MLQHNIERALPTTAALRIAEQASIEFGLAAKLNSYGVELKTYCCKLVDEKHRNIFYGFGKGRGLQSKASAYYEALEHYAVHRCAQDIANDTNNYQYLAEYRNPLPCINLKNVYASQTIDYPIYLLDPRYSKRQAPSDLMDYSSVAWRASDSGIASGTNRLEASIHALNELIERDAHSLFLIEAFIKTRQQHIRLIDKSTLPHHLQQIVNTIETQYAEKLMLFDITSDIGIPVMYVSMTQQPFLIQPAGVGASLSAEYALERALLECLQPVHIHNERLWQNQRAIIDNLRELPLLLKAAIADVTKLQDICQVIDFISYYSNPIAFDLEAQLQTISEKIATKGCNLFTIPLMELPSGFTCVKFYIPEFEQFHLVQTGKRVLPNKRGMRILSRGESLC